MFKESRLIFYYTTSPTHMGAGDGLGTIDSPIQREVQTNYPLMAGSGIKGAIRHELSGRWGYSDDSKGAISAIFGPDTSGSDFAGAVSFSDANIALFPVRSIKNGYVYATSRESLARLKRSAEIAGVAVPWSIPSSNGALVANSELIKDNKVTLEQFEVEAKEDSDVKAIASWISERTPDLIGQHFKEKIANDFVVLDDRHFYHFVTNSTVVEPHVRIDDETGTASDGGLFYVENLPSESLLFGIMMASDDRSKKSNMSAKEVVAKVEGDKNSPGINESVIQFGGDATYGRGLVAIRSVEE